MDEELFRPSKVDINSLVIDLNFFVPYSMGHNQLINKSNTRRFNYSFLFEMEVEASSTEDLTLL